MTAHFHNPSLTIHLPGRHLAVPDHGGLKNTSQSRFSSASLQRLRQYTSENNAAHTENTRNCISAFRGRRTGVDGHISPEEILPVTSGESHSQTRGKWEDKEKKGYMGDSTGFLVSANPWPDMHSITAACAPPERCPFDVSVVVVVVHLQNAPLQEKKRRKSWGQALVRQGDAGAVEAASPLCPPSSSPPWRKSLFSGSPSRYAAEKVERAPVILV